MQNEMIKVMSHKVLREIAASLHATPFYTIMVDETTDFSNREQVIVCLRWVSEEFLVHEEFMELYMVESIDANMLVFVIHDVLCRFNLTMSKVRSHCYDGAPACNVGITIWSGHSTLPRRAQGNLYPLLWARLN